MNRIEASRGAAARGVTVKPIDRPVVGSIPTRRDEIFSRGAALSSATQHAMPPVC